MGSSGERQTSAVMAYSRRTDSDSQDEDLAGLVSSQMQSYTQETRERTPSMTGSNTATAQEQQPRLTVVSDIATAREPNSMLKMLQRWLGEPPKQGPWNSFTFSRLRLSQQGGVRNDDIADFSDSSQSSSTDADSLQNTLPISRLKEFRGAGHNHTRKKRHSKEQDDAASVQAEATASSTEDLRPEEEDVQSLISSASSSSLVSYARRRPTIDRRFAELDLRPVYPGAGAKLLMHATPLAGLWMVEVMRRGQVVAVLLLISLLAISLGLAYFVHAFVTKPYSHAPTDAAPSNHATADKKAPKSSQKRSDTSKRKPKSSGNRKRVDDASESDDEHRRTRQRITPGHLGEVEQRHFACPFCKVSPQRYRRMCGEVHYPSTSSGVYSLQVCTWDEDSRSHKSVQKEASANKRCLASHLGQAWPV